nr:PREDICTED: WD repeat-containing protein 88 [Latimeria chalumnae]|eukprot:XP_014348564.1 PREDICTED: WD repeat-containing protein 88 [Latimeria chalumnae]
METGVQIPIKVLRGHSDIITSCSFCFEDTRVITSSYDKTVRLQDINTGEVMHIFEGEHTAPISDCVLSQDHKRLITASWDKTVKAWDTETGKVLWTSNHEGPVISCNISSHGKYVTLCSDIQNTLYIIDGENGTNVAQVKDHHESTMMRCCFDPGNQRVASVSSDRTIKLWDMIAKRTTVTIKNGHSNVISDCCFSLNGHFLCTASWDTTLKIWDIMAGEFRSHGAVNLTMGHQGSVSSCAFSKDASLLVSGAYDKSVCLWDTAGACKKLALKGHEDWVMDVALSADNKWILSCSKDCTSRLWNIENHEYIPAVIETRRVKGLRVVKCEECGKPFSTSEEEKNEFISTCVFCRLASPSRHVLPCLPDP